MEVPERGRGKVRVCREEREREKDKVGWVKKGESLF